MEWIDINDELPPIGEWILIGSASIKCVDYGAYFNGKFYMCGEEDKPIHWATHWSPLPDSPII